MDRINIAWLMETFATANELSNYNPKSTYAISRSRDALDLIVSQHFFRGKLRASFIRARAIVMMINSAIEEAEKHPVEDEKLSFLGPNIPESHLGPIRTGWNELKPILSTEIGIMPTYFVTSISAYDTDALIENGETLFPDSLLELIPSTTEDAKMAGNALVFRMPTSCAFHIFRILEAVAREYFRKVEPSIQKTSNAWMDLAGAGYKRVRR